MCASRTPWRMGEERVWLFGWASVSTATRSVLCRLSSSSALVFSLFPQPSPDDSIPF